MGVDFKVYINNGKEHFSWQNDTPFAMTKQEIKKDFELSQSLLDMIDMDTDKLYLFTERIGKEIRNLYNSDKEHDTASLRNGFDELAEEHIYFEFVRLDWYDRLDKFDKREYKSPRDKMFYKEITHIPMNIGTWQNEVNNIIVKVLDVFSHDKPIQQKMVDLYQRPSIHNTFTFETLNTKFEPVNKHIFAEVLRPNSLRDLIDFLLREIIRREITFKACKSCGRYFPATGHGNSEHCNRLFQDTRKTCKEIGSVKMYQAKVNENPEFKAYNRAYKTHFARIKAGKMTRESFQAWSKQAREFRNQVTNEKMRLADFETWLKW